MASEVEVIITAQDNFSSALGNFGNILTGIKSAIDLVGDAFRFASDTITPFINSAVESENAIAQLEAVLKATGGAAGLSSEELQNMANELQNVTRFSDETILAGTSMLLTFRNIGEETFPRATEAMLDMAAMFGSVDSAAVQLGKALNDPIAGVGALQRIGIQFTEEQKEMIKGFVEMGDVAAAQNVILKEVEMQLGGLAVAMGSTFAGQMDILKNRLDEVREIIGTALLPILEIFVNKFTDWLPIIEDFGVRVADIFSDLATGLETGDFSAFFAQLDELETMFIEALEGVDWTAAGTAFGEALVSIINTGVEVGKSEAAVALGQAMKELFIAAFDVLEVAITDWFRAGINKNLDAWRQVGRDIVNGVSAGFSDGIGGLFANATKFWQDLINVAKSILGIASPSTVFMGIGQNIVQGLVAGISSLAGWAATAIGNLVDLILAPFRTVLDLLGIDTGGTGGASGTSDLGGGGSVGGRIPTLPGDATGGGTVVNQYFSGATINVGSWDEIAYECMYPDPFSGATSGQLGGSTGGRTGGR